MTHADTHAEPVPSLTWWDVLTDPAFLENPYPELARRRALGSIHHDAETGVYFVLGHRAFSRIAKAPQMGRDTRLWTGGWTSPGYAESDPVGHALYSQFQPQMINSDPPDHGRMRAVYEPAFRPQATAALEGMIAAEAARLIAAMPDKGTVDMIADFAGPLPLRVLRNLFEVPAGMDGQIAAWSAALIKVGDIMLTPDQKREALAAQSEFKDFLKGHLAARRGCPHAGMMGSVIKAADAGTLDEEETLTNLVSMLIAGHETTVTLIGNGLLLLLRHPDQMARLRADRSLTRSALEEFLRVEPGGNMILRIAREDFEADGVRIPAGAPVIGLIGAINRDPERFEDPDTLDIGRGANAHLTFGGGVHFCVGAPLARLEGQVAFNMLLDRFPHMALDGKPEWRLDRINARGLGTLPVRVGPAA